MLKRFNYFYKSSISSFDIISFVVPEPKIILFIPESAADAAAVNHNGNKTLLDNVLITFFTKGNPVCNSLEYLI